MKLSSDQKTALKHILDWHKKDKNEMPYITLGGYAGTGKTTLIAVLRQALHKQNDKLKVGFASYTGKASRVLQDTLKNLKILNKQDSVGTIHSLIYSPLLNDDEEIVGWKQKDKIKNDLIIIDEASMVDEKIWQHLLSYGIPIIAVGDHGQLPPIKGKLNLMKKPDLILNEIHRQAKENPIIDVSIQARKHGAIPTQNFGSGVRKYAADDIDGQETLDSLLSGYNSDTMILCGYNKTRKQLNHHIRNALGFETQHPTVNDRVICLRNNHTKQIFNGMLGTIVRITKESDDWYKAEIAMDNQDKNFSGLISVKQFNQDSALNFTNKRSATLKGDLFDFGYALTVHKAQGSQAKRVVLMEQRFHQMNDDDWKRWLYTAVTRAEEELFIFSQN